MVRLLRVGLELPGSGLVYSVSNIVSGVEPDPKQPKVASLQVTSLSNFNSMHRPKKIKSLWQRSILMEPNSC